MFTPITKSLNASQERMLFVYQSQGGWGKGKSIEEAIRNYKSYNRMASRGAKLGIVSIYLVLNDTISLDEALKEIQISDFNMTYTTDNVIFLGNSVVKGKVPEKKSVWQ